MADVNPRGDDGAKLKAYWLTGPGAAKWSTFTELYSHLVKYMRPDKACLLYTSDAADE